MAHAPLPLAPRRFGETMRTDAWWASPAGDFSALQRHSSSTRRGRRFQGNHYTFGPYLSPFYSPELFGDSPHALVRTEAGVVAGAAPLLAGHPDSLGAGRFPLHLLLLSRRLLQGVLGRSAHLLRRRAALVLSRRAPFSADPPERPSVLPVPRRDLPRRARCTTCGTRCGSPTRRDTDVRHRYRHAHPRGEPDAAQRLHVRLPFAAPPGRRHSRSHWRSGLRGASCTIARAASIAITCSGPASRS